MYYASLSQGLNIRNFFCDGSIDDFFRQLNIQRSVTQLLDSVSGSSGGIRSPGAILSAAVARATRGNQIGGLVAAVAVRDFRVPGNQMVKRHVGGRAVLQILAAVAAGEFVPDVQGQSALFGDPVARHRGRLPLSLCMILLYTPIC